MEVGRRLLVGVIMATVLQLVLECAMSLTLSSRLIHKFSEELKSARVSRSGGEPSRAWPERRNLEYYRMLVSSDVRRQKMRLGPRYQLLFPSEGSQTMSFGNDLDWLHYTWIDIGTPNVSFLVALDSGSDLLWVPCDCIQCAPLSSSYYDSLDRDLNEYSPSGSITSKHLSCSHHLCILGGPNCKSPKQPCPYTAKYEWKDTFSSGFLVEDTMHFAARSDNATNISAEAPVIIGCGRKQSGGYLVGAAPDGVMGLGLGEISVPSLLAKAGLLRNSFSLCFNEDASGRVFFGDQGPSAQQSTPFLPLEGKLVVEYAVGVEACCIGGSCLDKTNFKALVDSGTSFTFLPQKAYEMVVQEFDRQVNATSVEGSDLKYCYKSRPQEIPKIPSLTLKFASNNSFLVHDPVLRYNDSEEVFCLAIQPIDGDLGIIGQNYMTGYRLVFDRENLKLCWSPSNCQDLSDAKTMPLTPPRGSLPNPLPTTEQQSLPNGHGVAPAVAERTPSKPSAASPQQLSSRTHLVNFLLLLLFLHLHFSGH